MENQKQFEGEGLKLTVTVEPGCQVKMDVEVSSKLTEDAYGKALKKINKEVSIPGFRKGRAPVKMIEDKYASHIDSEFKDIVVGDAFNGCLKLSEVYPLNNRSMKPPKMDSCARSEGAKISFEFESNPETPELKRDEVEIPAIEEPELTGEDLDKGIEELKDVYATFTPVEGRAAQSGDRVMLTISSKPKEEGAEGVQLCNAMAFDIAEGKMGKWMQELIVGQEKGATVEGTSRYEEDNATISEEEFEPTELAITIEDIQEPSRAANEVELAERMQLADADALRERVSEDLRRRTANQARAEAMTALRDGLLAKHNFEIPTSLLIKEREMRLRNLREGLKEQGLSDERIEEEITKLSDKISKDSEETLRLFFLLRDVAEAEKIEVEHDELLREYSMQMYNIPRTDRVIHEGQEPEDIRTRLYIELLNHKVLDFLIGKPAEAA